MRLTRIRRHIQGGGLLIMLLTANAGCSVFEHHDNAPIFPMTGAASPFDIVFLDPPFEADAWEQAAGRIEAGGWLRQDAWIYVESPAARTPLLPEAWREHRVGAAGNVRFALYRRAAPDPLS